MTEIFKKLGISAQPLVLAPLAGVSDHPFRRVCARLGADLTYVEMLSSTALLRDSRRTLQMMERHPSENRLGVQITGNSAEEISQAIAKLDTYNFDTIDINMGCPVRKVVGTGCGSALMRDPKLVYEIVRQSRAATKKPLSVKTRIGWDHQSINALELGDAIEKGGADWMTLHGRTRSDDYQMPVNLELMRQLREKLNIPLIGNGNIFKPEDADYMFAKTQVDGLMISRGALGNPWIFMQIKDRNFLAPTLDDWFAVVKLHLEWQREAYGDSSMGALCMRKHLLWYTKGWLGSKKIREQMNTLNSLDDIQNLLEKFVEDLAKQGISQRDTLATEADNKRFLWDPKWDMHREHDRGVGE